MFIGATGKSAQLILHTWLADAMEGERNQNKMFIKNTAKIIKFMGKCSPRYKGV